MASIAVALATVGSLMLPWAAPDWYLNASTAVPANAVFYAGPVVGAALAGLGRAGRRRRSRPAGPALLLALDLNVVIMVWFLPFWLLTPLAD